MKINVKCTRTIADSNLLGIFSADFDGIIAIRDIKLVKGKKGKFISWPSRSYEADGETKYVDIAFVMDKDVKADLEKKIKKAYEKALEEDED